MNTRVIAPMVARKLRPTPARSQSGATMARRMRARMQKMMMMATGKTIVML